MPESLDEKRKRYLGLGMTAYDVEVVISDRRLFSLFDRCLALRSELFRELCVLITQEVSRYPHWEYEAEDLVYVSDLWKRGLLSSTNAKRALELISHGLGTAEGIVASQGLLQENDEAMLMSVVEEIVSKNPRQVSEYLAGKEKVMGFLVGQAMKQTQGKGNPSVLQRLIRVKILEGVGK
jgi:aspartyl-tRNA(Asn)/glutamyl-tRNA(Gln) amidotransferase subunit B